MFFPTENGRVRYILPYSSTAAKYIYDYFITDHLGNTRMVLTEQTDFTHYLATMELEKSSKENALFATSITHVFLSHWAIRLRRTMSRMQIPS